MGHMATTDCPDWPLDPGCLGADWDALDPAVQERAGALAVATLHRLSGYRVGGCPVTVRPCTKACLTSYAVSTFYRGWGPAQLPDGTWVNTCGCIGTDCSCVALCEVTLAAPVGPISWVKVDGNVVLPTNYRVDGNRLLWIGAGDCPWPICQDMTAGDDKPDTFAVRYLNGYAPDAMASWAAGVMAMEFAKACVGGKCRLPANVVAVSRAGISYTVAAGSFPDGFTGIHEVDAWISLWNPHPIRQQAKVWSPDLRRARVVNS
jgi:hypothetical protein